MSCLTGCLLASWSVRWFVSKVADYTPREDKVYSSRPLQEPRKDARAYSYTYLRCPNKSSAPYMFHAGVLTWLIIRLWSWMQYIPPKGRLTLNELHEAIAQKAGLFINTTVRTPAPICKLNGCQAQKRFLSEQLAFTQNNKLPLILVNRDSFCIVSLSYPIDVHI
jgi:hypothetical protein